MRHYMLNWYYRSVPINQENILIAAFKLYLGTSRVSSNGKLRLEVEIHEKK